MPTIRTQPPASAAIAVGIFSVLIAFLLAELVTFPSNGHRIDTSKWPTEAQSVLRETPGNPVSPDQWRRINQVLQKHGNMNYGQRPYWAQTVRESWWWFIALPLLATFLVSVKRGKFPFGSTALMVAPSATVLVVALSLTGCS